MSAAEWLPDWRDKSRYPSVEGTLTVQWAWEFLRRNPAYQADFVSMSAQELSAKWCIRFALDPSTPSSDDLFLHHEFTVKSDGDFRILPAHFLDVAPETIGPELKTSNMLTVFVDLSQPLTHQLDRIEQAARSAQVRYCKEFNKSIPKTKNYRPQDYANYLRILDGLAASESLAAIANVLYGDDSDAGSAYRKTQKNKKAAIELRDGGYLDIARVAVDAEASYKKTDDDGDVHEYWTIPYA